MLGSLESMRRQYEEEADAMGRLGVALVGAAYHTPQPPHWYIPPMAMDARELLAQVYAEAARIPARGDYVHLALAALVRKYTEPPYRELTHEERGL